MLRPFSEYDGLCSLRAGAGGIQMWKFRSMLCGLVVAFTACADVSPADDPGDPAPTESARVQTITQGTAAPFSVSPNTVTCTDTFGVCKVGQCELGANDTFQRVTEVCCDSSGSCTTELYRLCGC
jgi:hypothetical protein